MDPDDDKKFADFKYFRKRIAAATYASMQRLIKSFEDDKNEDKKWALTGFVILLILLGSVALSGIA